MSDARAITIFNLSQFLFNYMSIGFREKDEIHWFQRKRRNLDTLDSKKIVKSQFFNQLSDMRGHKIRRKLPYN